jgi:hypothetical protein
MKTQDLILIVELACAFLFGVILVKQWGKTVEHTWFDIYPNVNKVKKSSYEELCNWLLNLPTPETEKEIKIFLLVYTEYLKFVSVEKLEPVIKHENNISRFKDSIKNFFATPVINSEPPKKIIWQKQIL